MTTVTAFEEKLNGAEAKGRIPQNGHVHRESATKSILDRRGNGQSLKLSIPEYKADSLSPPQVPLPLIYSPNSPNSLISRKDIMLSSNSSGSYRDRGSPDYNVETIDSAKYSILEGKDVDERVSLTNLLSLMDKLAREMQAGLEMAAGLETKNTAGCSRKFLENICMHLHRSVVTLSHVVTIKMIAILLLAKTLFSSPTPLPIAWGFATSAYQIEGAWNVSGKGPSVWDDWFLSGRPILSDREGLPPAPGSPFISADHYNRMPSDIAILGNLKATAYRFSISWPRIFPNCSGTPNQAGIDFYSSMIDEILKNGADPVMTLFHWDTPSACHSQYGSWGNERIVADFTNYADLLFEKFGSRVQRILTINEPGAMCGRAYGPIPPTDKWLWPPGLNGSEHDKFMCVQYTILAHASVVKMARTKHASKNLKFGLPLIIEYGIPLDPNNPADVTLARRTTTAQADWVWGPFYFGDYPAYLRELRGEPIYNYFNGLDLPTFTDSQKADLKGTMDFLAINYYSASYRSTTGASGPALPRGGASWQSVYPEGIRAISKELSEYYGNMEVMISECGFAVPNEEDLSVAQRVDDRARIDFFTKITAQLSDAILIDKTPITMFLAWSLMDNLEWLTFDQMWGCVNIDHTGNTLNRNIKNSARSLSDYFSNAVTPFKLATPLTDTPKNQTGYFQPPGNGTQKSNALTLVTGAALTGVFAAILPLVLQ